MESIREENEHAEPWRPGTEEASRAVKSAREGFETLSHRVADAVDVARDKMAEFREHGLDKMKRDAVNYTKERPANALLVAAGVGVLIGILAGLRRR